MAAPSAETAPGNEKDDCEIGDLAVWSLSTAKPGNGVEQLRDDRLDTYWQ
jgi:anaphase-promoting complex subunit 10